MPRYATVKQLEVMRDALKADQQPCVIATDVSGLAALLVCTLDTLSYPDIGEKDSASLLALARQLADLLENQRPDAEPYIAMLFGVASLRRGAPLN